MAITAKWVTQAAMALYGPFEDSPNMLRKLLGVSHRQWNKAMADGAEFPDDIVMQIELELRARGNAIDAALLEIVDFQPA